MAVHQDYPNAADVLLVKRHALRPVIGDGVRKPMHGQEAGEHLLVDRVVLNNQNLRTTHVSRKEVPGLEVRARQL